MRGGFALNQIHHTDALTLLKGLADESVNCIVTSPPYFGLRDYGVNGQLGLEATPDAYVEALVQVFREARRVLRADGTFWLNLGDTYSNAGKSGESVGANNKQGSNKGSIRRTLANTTFGAKPKDLLLIPTRVALALQADGWIVRADVIWAKDNPMPESVTDRPTKSHEHVFLLVKSPTYFYDADAIKEDAVNGDPTHPRGSQGVTGQPNAGRRDKQSDVGKRQYAGFNGRWDNRPVPLTKRNRRDVWHINPKPYPGAHFAVMPEELARLCVLAGCPEGGVVLDMFMGSGTVARVAHRLGRQYVGGDINPQYVEMARESLLQKSLYESQFAGDHD